MIFAKIFVAEMLDRRYRLDRVRCAADRASIIGSGLIVGVVDDRDVGRVGESRNAIPLGMTGGFETTANHRRSERRTRADDCTCYRGDGDGAGRVISSDALSCGDLSVLAENVDVHVLLALVESLIVQGRFRILDVGFEFVDGPYFEVERLLLINDELAVRLVQVVNGKVCTGVILFRELRKAQDVEDRTDAGDVALIIAIDEVVKKRIGVHLLHDLRGEAFC